MLKVMKEDFWVKRLPTIVRRGYATDAEVVLASDFRTCAVAEANRQQPLVVKYVDDKPDDGDLYELGVQFYEKLEDGRENQAEPAENVRAAATVYAEIMARTAKLALLRKFKVSE